MGFQNESQRIEDPSSHPPNNLAVNIQELSVLAVAV